MWTRWLGAGCLCVSSAVAADEQRVTPEAFLAANPGCRVHLDSGGVSRIYGEPLARGAAPRRSLRQSAESFLIAYAPLLGVQRDELIERGPFPGGQHEIPLMYDPQQGRYRFSSLHYAQAVEGIPVFRSRLTLLLRNEPSHPVVLAATNLRELGEYRLPAPGVDAAAVRDRFRSTLPPETTLGPPRTVIWAGTREAPAAPRLAVEVIVRQGSLNDPGSFGQWLTVIDADSGATLYQEDQVLSAEITGSVSGMATSELGADFCAPEALLPLPYAQVELDGTVVFADAQGHFAIQTGASGPLTVTSLIGGPYFHVFNAAGIGSVLSTVLTPPGLVQFVHNGANAYEMERSQVNAYVHANVVRDFVLAVHPDFPGIADQADFPINVNLNANCNAFYVPGSPSINFFTSGNGCPNTAYDTVVYHEFGHHLVNMGGSGQGAYGEGMSDVIAVLVTDQPVVGAGWRGDCEQWLRTADNDCQYSPLDCTSNCGSEIHACGRLLSGSIWTLRNALFDVDPTNAHALVTALALNSILLHEGSSIGPDIAIDFLVLDDDNGNLLDGTPHYPQIAAAFAAHGLDLPVIDPIGFSFPNGLPERIAPAGGSTVRVEVGGLLGAPQPGTGVFHVSVEGPLGPFVEVPMFEIEPNVYDAVFPAADCGSEVSYFFSAESVGGITVTHPASVPAGSFTAVAATGVQLAFAEDFEAASGWTIENDAGLSGGAWQIGVPAGDGDRGDPLIDGDGSGQCALTGNEAGNSDVDGGATMLISPPLDLPNGPAFLSYDRWYSNGAGNNPGQDVFLVQVSADGGSTWMDLEVVGPAGVDTGGGWVHRDSRVDGLLAAGQPLRIRFVASDTNPPSIVEAAVDGVTVRVFSCQACAGDVTGDGEVDVADLLAVLLAWGEVDSPADVDGSGLIDVLDLVALLQDWGSCA